jgi:YesN/AraC family two-component response regulator
MHPFYEIKKNFNSFYYTIFECKDIQFPPHLHSYVEIVYILEGKIKTNVNEHEKIIKKNEFAVIFPNDIHNYETIISSKSIIVIFSPEIINGYFSNKFDITLKNPYFSNNIDIHNFLYLILDEKNHNNNEFVIKGLLYAIFGKFDSKFEFINKKYYYTNTIQILLSYISSHFTENITLDHVADNIGLSKFYISRIFKNKIGYQFNEYINRLRINMAQSLLIENDMKILSIALECGFNSQRTFNRVFKENTMMTPTEFKQSKNSCS